MQRQIITIAAGVVCAAGGLFGQPAGRGGVMPRESSFQQSSVMAAGTIQPVMGGRGAGNAGPLIVSGKPLSGTEERKTTQTLGDGTMIERSDSNQLYRDSQGRVRAEQVWNGKTVIGIMDPVSRFFVQLDPVAKTARKTAIPESSTTGGITVREGMVSWSIGSGMPKVALDKLMAERAAKLADAAGQAGGATQPVASSSATDKLAAEKGARDAKLAGFAAGAASKPSIEELGSQNLNGALAQGTRSTLTIPAGQIGNNRDIHVVNERWFSSDLQLLVKSVNSDPRFGVTTYELVNIQQVEPSPALFEIPPDYKVTEATNRVEPRPVIN